MNILTCFKIVSDLDLMSESDWVVEDHFRINTSFVKNMINPYDESALEITLLYKEQAEKLGSAVNLSALTIGSKQLDAYLKTLYALRFDKAVRIENQHDLRFSPDAISTVIANYVKVIKKPEVIILGRQSGVGDNAKTPLLVAEHLGWPCISQAVKIEPASEGLLKVSSMADDGLVIETIRPPCVLSIGNAPNSYLRIPTLKDKVNYGKKEIEVLEIENYLNQAVLEQPSEGHNITGLKPINHKRQGVVIEGSTPAEKAQNLYHNYLQERLKQL